MNNIGEFSKLEEELGKGRVKLNEPLSLHCTWKIGGPAHYWFEAKTPQDIIMALKKAHDLKLRIFILGGGSNILFSDKGFDGMVIKNSTDKIKILGLSGKRKGDDSWQKVFVEAESGVTFNRLVRYTLDEGLSGLEYFLGQPGTVGGALYINAHFPKESKFVGDYLQSANISDLYGNTIKVTKDYFQYGYDVSRIQKTGEIVLSATFGLFRSTKEEVWKKGNKAIKFRQESQPQGYPTAGCTFRNLSESEAIIAATPNHTRSAGFLIDQCGLKEFTVGNAQISQKHANFILNKGNAKASDVIKIINICKEKVQAKFKVELKEEVVLAGDFNG